MVIREQFYEDLENLKNAIETLANHTVEAFDASVDAFYVGDIEKAQEIMDRDVNLDQEELDINEKAILLIAKQQPVAKDLRRLIVALKISSDLERMADHATNIGKSTLHLGADHDLTIHPAIRDMANVAKDMVAVAIKAFHDEDVTLARKLAEMDDRVDNIYGEIIREMLEQTATNPQKIQHIMQMAFCARYIERFADHITNIGENIFYLVKGQTFDLND